MSDMVPPMIFVQKKNARTHNDKGCNISLKCFLVCSQAKFQVPILKCFHVLVGPRGSEQESETHGTTAFGQVGSTRRQFVYRVELWKLSVFCFDKMCMIELTRLVPILLNSLVTMSSYEHFFWDSRVHQQKVCRIVYGLGFH